MSWIRVIHERDAGGTLAEAYARIAERRGKVSNIMRVQSLAPDAMEAHMDLYMHLMFGRGGLGRAEREMLAVAVSVENGCEYCTLHHAAALEAWWKDPGRVARLRHDPGSAELSRREAAFVEYARRLTREPAGVTNEHVAPLRDAGLESPPDEVGGYRY